MEITIETNKSLVSCYYDSYEDEVYLYFDDDEEPWKGWSEFADESFADYVDSNDLRDTFSDEWDYSIESHYTSHFTQDWDDYLGNAHDDLEFYVKRILKKAGLIK